MVFYDSRFVMSNCDLETNRKVDLWTFKSTKSNKRYIVEIEHFPKHFLGVKFFWKGVSSSPSRYNFLTNDYEPRTIVNSCIMVMLKYYDENPETSFGFVASENEYGHKSFPNKRFRFYRRMMLSLFSPEKFVQIYDISNSVYLLLNKESLSKNSFSIKDIVNYMKVYFEGEFKFD